MAALDFKPYEQELLNKGFENMSVPAQNSLVSELSDKFGVSYLKVTSKMILDVHKALKAKVVTADYRAALERGYFHINNGHIYSMSIDNQTSLIGIKVLTLSKQQATIKWLTEDVDELEHTMDEFNDVYDGLMTFKQAAMQKYNGMLTKISDATSHTELLNIGWEIAPLE